MNVNEMYSRLEVERDQLEIELLTITKRIERITELMSDIRVGRPDMAALEREFHEED